MARILIVDDERSIRITLWEFLRDAGYEAGVAEDAEEALGTLAADVFDVVVADMIMPQITGVRLLKAIRESAPHVQVILMTGEPTVETAAEAVRAGAFDYLTKPIDKTQLLKTVANAVRVKTLDDERRRLAEENRQYQENLERLVEERTADLRKSEELNRSITQTAADAIISINSDGIILSWNDAAERIFGYSSSEMVNKDLLEVMHAQSRAGHDTGIERLKNMGKEKLIGQTIEFTVLRKGGTEFPVELSSSSWETGNQKYYTGIIRDITQRKQAEEELRVKDSAIASSINAIALANLEGNLTYVNDSFLQIWGYDDDTEILGKPAVGFWQTQDKATEVVEALQSRGSWTGELTASKKDGSTFDVQLSASIVTSAETGQPICMMASFVDVTERNLLEGRLREQERLAAVGQLAAGFAHDFNNILTSTLLYADVLRHRPHLPAQIASGLEGIISESRRAANLVQQFLDFGRRSILDRQQVDLLILVENVSETLRRSLPETIHIHIERERGDFGVNVDPGRIQQTLMNLATNAQDAMPEGGELYIGLSRVRLEPGTTPPVAEMESGEWVCLTVSDTGVGIPPDALPHIFEPFFTTKEVGQGTGLGLPQVYGIVKQHDGHISVETWEGRGTTFRVFLPPLTVEEMGDAPHAKESELPPVEKETILLVEAHRQLREVIQQALETQGYRVLPAANGRDALRIHHSAEMGQTAQDPKVDLVIMDVTTPVVEGMHLMQELRKANPRLKGLAITDYAPEEDRQTLREAGIMDAIRKPFYVDVLMEAIQQALK